MKIKCLICLFLCISLCAMIGCTSDTSPTLTNNRFTPSLSPTQNILNTEGDKVSNCTLIVNGNDITEKNYVKINEDYAELPFIAIMIALGAEIFWQSTDIVEVIYNAKNYILNTTECTFIEMGKNINLFSPPPGGTRYYKTLENEFILDSVTTIGAFQLMKTSIKININYDEKIITINN